MPHSQHLYGETWWWEVHAVDMFLLNIVSPLTVKLVRILGKI